MSDKVGIAFEPAGVFIKLADILPLKQFQKRVKTSKKYSQIKASMREIGIIEPPVVVRERSKKGKYLLLDGHLRLEILKDLGVEEVQCLLATKDEAFTYNRRVNRLATIQGHKMILNAIERGVPQERIAKVLDVNVANIRRRQTLLDGICPEAAELLKDRHCPLNTFSCLRKMNPIRQVEVAELMTAMDNYSTSYSRALLAATPQDQLVDTSQPKSFKGISAEQIAQMESEMAKLQQDMKLIEDDYGLDHLNLVLARGYVGTLLDNQKVCRYLMQNHDGLMEEFGRISDVVSTGAEELG